MFTADDLADVTAPLNRASTLPPQCYTSPEVYAQEQRHIFEREWHCVARVEQIPNAGDFLCVELFGQPLVVLKRDDKTIHAMSSVCLHRAMPICTGSGNAKSFSCPYHLWKYALDGRLISAPMMDDVLDFPPEGCKLPAVAVEVWQGFVLVNLAPNAEPLSPRLERLTKMLMNYGLSHLVVASTVEFDSPWNWKLLIENFMEAYHHIGPHSDTLQPRYPAKDSYVVGAEDHLWSALHMPGIPPAEGEAPALPYFPSINDMQRHHLIACVVSPTLIFAVSGSSVFWYQLEPLAHDRMNLKIHVLLRPDTLTDARYAEQVAGATEVAKFIHLQDIAVNEGPFKGLHAPLARAGRLSLLEESIWHMNQFWAERMLAD